MEIHVNKCFKSVNTRLNFCLIKKNFCLDPNPGAQSKVSGTRQKFAFECLLQQPMLQLQHARQVCENYLDNMPPIGVSLSGITKIQTPFVFFSEMQKAISDPHCPCATMPPPLFAFDVITDRQTNVTDIHNTKASDLTISVVP